MATLSKRATIYFDPAIHDTLRTKSAETLRSISEIVNEALCYAMAEGAEDLEAFEVRAGDRLISYEDLIQELKTDGRV
jgi:hypothetical protein